MLYQLSHVRARYDTQPPLGVCGRKPDLARAVRLSARNWPKPPGQPVAAGQRLGGDETGHPDGDDDELGDPVSRRTV